MNKLKLNFVTIASNAIIKIKHNVEKPSIPIKKQKMHYAAMIEVCLLKSSTNPLSNSNAKR